MGSSVFLRNESLLVEVAAPGQSYKGSRFDWTGWIKQVTWDEDVTFCTEESLVPGRGTGGSGLCSEFGIEEPIGYDDCAQGEAFPKLGVGLLRRHDSGSYSFAHPYSVEPFPVHVIKESDRAISFRSEPLPCRGYEALLHKTIRLEGQHVLLDFELKNVGTRTIRTTEYNHNFVRIGTNPIGSDYRLKLSFRPDGFQSQSPYLVIRDEELRWLERPAEGECFYGRTRSFDSKEAGEFSWTLLHEPSGYGITETLDRPLHRFAVWGEGHVVSPELFHEIVAEPARAVKWRRSYRFFREQGNDYCYDIGRSEEGK